MIHIVYQQADVAVLQDAIQLDKSLEGEILEIKDELAVGPLKDLDSEQGWNERLNWWKELVQNSPYQEDIKPGEEFDDRRTIEQLKTKLNAQPGEQAWIWVGQNQHDVCGYYWAISQLKEYTDRVYILFLNNLPFIDANGKLFYPKAIHDILPKEIIKAKKICRKVTSAEFEVDSDEWKRIISENAFVRILEGGKKIISKEETFYDKDILNGLTGDWQKGNKAMQSIYSKMTITTGDVFLLWRIDHLVKEGKVEIKGDPSHGWKNFEVKLKDTAPVTSD